MATFYVDLENGNNNYSGTSFALLAQGTNGRITSTTFSSVGASFPNDGSLIGQYLSIFNGSNQIYYVITSWISATSLTIAQFTGGWPLGNQTVDRQYYIGGRLKTLDTGGNIRVSYGDTVRVMGSPAPTSLSQNGTWTSQTLQTTKAVSSSTNTTPISVTCNAHGYSTGDTIVITGHTTNTNANGTWEIINTGVNTFTLTGSTGNGVGGASGTARLRNNTRIMLTSAVTKNIASTGPGRSVWTPSTNVSTLLQGASGLFKEHSSADQITIQSTFTTGLAAYWATGTLDLSGYQQVSFWIYQSSGTIGVAGAVDLRLCSDTAGTIAVNIVSIPNLVATGRWMPVTVDLGTNLGNNIQSIALYVNTDNGAQTFLFSNIIACKASSANDSLTLTSLIGKNTSSETWWGIQSINGTRVMLDTGTNVSPTDSTNRGYYGASEVVTTWKRETIKLGPSASAVTGCITLAQSGIDGSPITYSGGWDRTNMSTQSLETWLDGVNGNGYGITMTTSYNWMAFEKFAFTRLYTGFSAYSFGMTFDIVGANNMSNSQGCVQFGCSRSKLIIKFTVANAGCGVESSGTNSKTIISGGSFSNATYGLLHSTGDNSTISGENLSNKIANNGQTGLYLSVPRISASNLTLIDNPLGDVSAYVGSHLYKNVAFNSTTEIYTSGTNMYHNIFSENHDQTIGNHKIFSSSALISSAIDQRYTTSGISWKFQPTNTERSASWPIVLSLARVACAANAMVTIKAWMRRDNAGLTMRLVCKGGQISGITNDVASSVTAVNTWEQQTITFTPTEIGIVEITAEAWGGTTYSGWVDDLTISQA